MDIGLETLVQTIPQAGVGGAIAWILILLIRRESAMESRHAAEYQRINEAHDAEIRDLRDQIVQLRNQIEELQVKLDMEREERRKAEDEAAAARRLRGVYDDSGA